MKQKVHGVGVGTISLIMIFAVLCLTVFAMLTLSSSNAEKILADRTASFVKGYYEADVLATEIGSKVLDAYKDGKFPENVDGTDIAYTKSGNASLAGFYCPINDVQELFVQLKLENGHAGILTWKTEPSHDWIPDDSLTVWSGDIFDEN